MKPLISVHAGEYLVAQELERQKLCVWIPTKDTGVDLLVTSPSASRVVKLQVKFSGDHSFEDRKKLRMNQGLSGFFHLDLDVLRKDPCQFWILAVAGWKTREMRSIIATPRALYDRIIAIHGRKNKRQPLFISITHENRCWETNGLGIADRRAIATGQYRGDMRRDLSAWFERWDLIKTACKEKE